MRWIRRVLIAVLLLVVLAFGLLFSLQNGQDVPLDLVAMRLPERPLAVWLLAAFVLGGLVGLAAGSLALVKSQATHYRLRRRLDICERELSDLKGSALRH